MQSIIHLDDYTPLHPIFSEFEDLYRALSNNDEVSLLSDVFDSSLSSFEETFNVYGNCTRHFTYVDKN